MATKKAAKKAAKPAAPKVVKAPLGKSGLVEYITTASNVMARDVRAVLAALEGAVVGSVNKNGARTFTLPGLLKITVASIPAKPKRKGINPFTKQEQWFAAKPASVRVKVRPLKKLKDAAA
jgi:nucleoid DNA-binding protein